MTVGEVAEVAIGPFGSSLKADLYVRDGMPVVSGMHLGRSISPSLDGADCVDQATVQRLERSVLRPGDLVFPHRGSIGRVGLVDRPMMMSTSMMRARFGPSVLPQFAYWYFVAEGNRQLLTMASSVGTPGIGQPLASLKSVPFLLPDLDVQQGIAEVLGALDDKIAANRRVIDGGHKIAQFRVEVALGDADRCRVGDVAEFLNRKRVPLSKGEREARPGEVPYYGAAGRLDTVDDSLFDEPLVLVGEDGTVITDEGRAVVQYIWGPSWVNNHAHVLRGTTVSTSLLRWLVYRAEVRHLVTGAVQPKISMGNLKTLELAVPGKDVRGALEDECDMFAAQERALSEENETLAKTRDELLPLLMSGKITVKDAEKRVEGVV
ncbi:restriction endonuclease subunit S [Dermacoccus nishinomiyaensis]|uniref:restriction endonuclease subunit S n=1 Tax=Dermacoccus nishinomiyaensis TaxID=1274 RepID=UPI00155910A6|nr:restriction endonuclease subunit S [Dermacoccus nishinomiyaensis]